MSSPEITDIRARIREGRGPGIAKADMSRDAVCRRRATEMYTRGVVASGGPSAVGHREEKHESTIRGRIHDDRKDPTLAQILAGFDRDGLYELAHLICDFGDEQERRTG